MQNMTIEEILRDHDNGVDYVIDNGVLHESKYWIFTFGVGQKHGGYYVKIKGTFRGARAVMIERYGLEWCWQYSQEEWDEIVNDKTRSYPLETEMEVIE